MFTMLVFIVMEAIIVGGYSHDLPGQVAHGPGFLPGGHGNTGHVTIPMLPYVVRSSATDQQLHQD